MADKISVLCVEDDNILRTLIELALCLDRQIAVTLAASSDDARALWTAGFRPDLVLLDFRLPNISGVELLAWLKDIGGMNAPAVFLTATTHHADLAAMMSAGAAGIIRKPFHPFELAAQVRAYLPGR